MSDGEASPAGGRGFAAWLGLIALTVLVGACGQPKPLANDAYVWQRKWTPAVSAAWRGSAAFVQRWHVLAAERDHRDDWTVVAPDWALLAATRAPVVAVVRIDGQPGELNDATLNRIGAMVEDWKRHGVRPVAVEIDHDCATSRLPAYTRFLAALRARLDPTIQLTITALPAWLDSDALDSLLGEADETVLQVHAVMNPVEGLFDPERARSWLRAFAKRTHRPWRVALPTYGTRVSWGDDGRVSGIESEQPMLLGNAGEGSSAALSHELVAQPAQISAFVARIERDALPGLTGVVWFRLPTDADQRAWSLATWRAVLTRAPLNAELDVRAEPADQPGLFDVALVSAGTADAPLPAVVRADVVCQAADGINGYALDYDAHGMLLRRVQPGLLRAGMRRNIGWLRCGEAHNPKVSLHVEP